jgi:hypothetical protein
VTTERRARGIITRPPALRSLATLSGVPPLVPSNDRESVTVLVPAALTEMVADIVRIAASATVTGGRQEKRERWADMVFSG